MAAAAAGAAAALLLAAPGPARLRRARAGSADARLSPVLVRVLAAATLGGALAGPVGAAVGAGLVGASVVAARRRATTADGSATLHALLILVAELRAGRLPVDAVAAAGAVADEPAAGGLRRAAAALRLGGDPTPFLRAGPDPTGALDRLAAGWQVSARTGAGLAAVVETIADDVRGATRQRREVQAQLAGPRATAWILAALPAVGIAFSAGLGADPRGVLLGTPVGLACLVAGVGLDAAGVLWVRRIARAAECA